MEEKVTVGKTINSWSCLESVPQSILLIGPSHTGRTTFAELIRKYVHGTASQGLVYDSGKYNFEGVISNKSIKIQTSYPVMYQKSRRDKAEVRLVDVPSFIYPPENKRWSALEQKLTVDLLVARSTRIGFVLFIEQKSTRTNIIPWKKSLIGFLELFKPQSLSDEFLDSIAFAITKAPPEIKQETMVARLKQLKLSFQKDKSILLNSIDKLFTNVIERNRVLIFKKVSGDQAEKESIINNWNQLYKLPGYNIAKEHLKEQAWQPEGEKALQEYFSTVETALKYIASISKELLTLPEYTSDRLRQAKRKRPDLPQDISVSGEIKAKFESQSKNIQYLSFIRRFVELSRQFSEITAENLEQVLDGIAKLGLFSDQEDYLPFQLSFEGLEFRRIEDFKQFQLQTHCQAFSSLFSQQVLVQVLRKLSLAEATNKRKEFYEQAIKLIQQSFSSVPSSLSNLLQGFNKALIKYSNPKQALQHYAKEISSQKNKSKQYAIACDVGTLLENNQKVQLFFEAGQVYRAGRNAGAAIRCLKKAAEKDQKAAKEYISYLAQLTLFQQAISACYQLADTFGYQSRASFQESLKGVENARRKYQSQGSKTNIFALDIEVETVRKYAAESKQKL